MSTIILDLPEYRTLTSLATADAARDASLQAILDEVNDAIVKALRQPLESATYTEYYDAPPTDRIVLRQWPVTAVTTVKVAPGSGGDPSKFTADRLLEQYKDWIIENEQPDGSSRSAVLRSTRGWWSVQFVRPVRHLGARMDPDRRAIQVVYVAGYDQIPYSLRTAAMLMTSRLYFMRKTGTIIGSASLNGASYSYQQPNTAQGLISDPVISEFLRPFQDVCVGVA